MKAAVGIGVTLGLLAWLILAIAGRLLLWGEDAKWACGLTLLFGPAMILPLALVGAWNPALAKWLFLMSAMFASVSLLCWIVQGSGTAKGISDMGDLAGLLLCCVLPILGPPVLLAWLFRRCSDDRGKLPDGAQDSAAHPPMDR